MSIKSVAKLIIPESVQLYRHDWKLARQIEEHKRMSRQEAEGFLASHYLETFGSELHFDDPRRYTEKIQWVKLNAMPPIKSTLADKYAVRDWVADKIGDGYLIPLVSVWDSPDHIDFTSLPDAFVLKTTHASATNIVVPDKSKLDERYARRLLSRWLALDYGWVGFDRHYMRIAPRVLCESYVCNSDGSEAYDYKFHCFGGRPCYVRLDIDRHSAGHSRATFDMDWTLQDWHEGPYPIVGTPPRKPECFDELKEVVGRLASDFGHVRVDFYVIDGRPLFGEMTFSSGGGFERIFPDEWDLRLGNLWDLSLEERSDFPLS